MLTATQAAKLRADTQFDADLARNEAVIKGAAIRQEPAVQVYKGSDPARMARELREKYGYEVEHTHGGIGLQVRF